MPDKIKDPVHFVFIANTFHGVFDKLALSLAVYAVLKPITYPLIKVLKCRFYVEVQTRLIAMLSQKISIYISSRLCPTVQIFQFLVLTNTEDWVKKVHILQSTAKLD